MADKDKEKDAAADAVEDGAEAAAEPKKRSPIIFIVIGVVVALLLSAGIAIFVTTQIIAGAGHGSGDDGEVDRDHEPGVFIQLGDPKEGILVNVGGPRGGKFLKATIVLEMNPNKKSVINEETKDFQPEARIKVMDMTMQFLRATKVEDFDAEKQDELKKQLKESLNAELGSSAVYDIYITSFLLQ